MTLPRETILTGPTPYEAAPRLAESAGLRALWIKREDLSGAAFGGNKLRSIELILGAARQAGADTLVTTAASQSNFCRALAGCAARAGLGCRLLLRSAGGRAETGNLLLSKMFGAEISFIDATDPWDPAIRDALHDAADALRASGRTPYVVQLPGETAALAAAGWALAAQEFSADFARAGTVPDVLAVACGSGLTLAGLAVGFARHGVATRLLGVSVQQPAARLHNWVSGVTQRTAALLGWDTTDAMARVKITDDQIAPGYAQPSAAGLDALLRAARLEGLVLDPGYTGKALAGLLAAATPGGTAAFLHSGGAPALFAQAETVWRAC